jgi:hypothetical protein
MDFEDMEVDGDSSDAVMMSRSGGDSSANGMGQETKITYAQPTYGLPSTHTCILPLTLTCGTGTLSASTPTKLSLRMNSINNILNSTITPYTTGPPTSYANQLTTVMFIKNKADGYGTDALQTAAALEPAYRDHNLNYYGAWTVLGCEYTIKVVNISDPNGYDSTQSLNFYSFNTIKAYKFLRGKDMPATNPNQIGIKYWPGIQEYIMDSRSQARSGISVIKGVWKPGDFKREVRDDTEAKVWTLGTANPTLEEYLELWLYSDYLTPSENWSLATMEITLKFIVQFKDLKIDYRMPIGASSVLYAAKA